MDGKVIILPNREEMLERLKKVSDNSYLQERFYPLLLESAGQKRVAQGVVMMLALAIHDFIEAMPPVMSTLMYAQAPEFIEALVDNPEVAEQAKTFLQKALSLREVKA